MDYQKYRQRVLAKDGKIKRILALDGGGIRGLITVQFLKKVEAIIRQQTGNPTALLRDHFHLIGGTSTGAIIAALIAIGKSADEIDTIYRELGAEIFRKSKLRMGILRPKYSVEALKKAMDTYLDDKTLEDFTDDGVGLCAVLKRLDSGSAWIVDNNPDGKYFAARPGSTTIPNKDYKLKQIVRASTAAPTFFEPELIPIAEDLTGLFVDGGVSPHNNPAFQMFMMTTINGYKYNWDVGEDKIFVLSLGTGYWGTEIADVTRSADSPAVKTGITALNSLLNDTRELNELMMQWISKPTGPVDNIDRVVGNLANETLCKRPLCSYMRYNIAMEEQWIAENLGLKYNNSDILELRDLGSVTRLDDFAKIGQTYAEKMIHSSHIL